MVADLSRDLVWIECDFHERDHCLNTIIDQFSDSNASVILVGSQKEGIESITHDRLVEHLGRSVEYAIYNAFDGFTPNALAQLSGMVQAPGLLFLVSPKREVWPVFADPNLQALGQFDGEKSRYISLLISNLIDIHRVDSVNEEWLAHRQLSSSNGHYALTRDQILCLSTLDHQWRLDGSVTVLTADRGRGKSTVIGRALSRSSFETSSMLVVAPDKRSVESLYNAFQEEAPHTTTAPRFMRPAEARTFLAQTSDVVLLVIDEAAAIPTPLLADLIDGVPHVAITTTVSGYEGFGRGFSLRFIEQLERLKTESLNRVQYVTMQTPVRWSEGDRLETFINQALFLNEPESFEDLNLAEGVHRLSVDQLLNHPALIEQVYHLLHFAHYRTSPNDLRVLLDSPGQHLFITVRQARLVAVVWVAEEGGMDRDLCEAVWAGERRPNGNLLPQSLMFHEGWSGLGTSLFWRITRVAVLDSERRQGIGAELIACVDRAAQMAKIDFLGASFAGYESIWSFWRSLGFTAIRVGDSLDSVAGQPPMMVLKGLSQQGSFVCDQVRERSGSRYRFECEHELRDSAPLGFKNLNIFPLQMTIESALVNGFLNRNIPWRLVRPWVYQYACSVQDDGIITACLRASLSKPELANVKQRLKALLNESHSIASVDGSRR